ncbi:aminotransferase class III-fold pyridoxal phosphate-dependent enzyme [Roseococcus sp. SYP-B2431]|uniref:aspartate aminotransferase family protein n=1 Tax=Roseococcus sp. SYP-B2431 TaxID=2496640 RepID=UPI00103DB577|nr:aminotransferase class III-fold pyridoxal phosphate-dependent enzyme [Roseococcus sp. SYP-B2431]TCI00977.1 aminotransferase class III-fold pyridoxal phosphate-dependent enzyme [Roseococcus sp. SYP-B2431]
MNDVATAETLVETAHRVLPAGNFGNFASDIAIVKGVGGHVWDSEGQEYIDYLLGSGPMFIGHAHPEVTAAVMEQVPLGTTFFTNNPHGIRLADRIVAALPCADQVRFLGSGTEADMYAMRVARAFRGRDKIVKFEGGYHGMSDHGLMSLAPKRPGNFPLAIPDSPGIPAKVRDDVLVAPYNDAAHVVALIEAQHDEIGGVIVEPFQRLIPPVPGFLEALREVTARFGIPLIFDEVVTGFRFAYGGAQSYYGVTPDLCTLGKIVGGGFPLSALAGRADIMAHFDKAKVGDEGFLMQVGTLSGNPVASVAGLATLDVLSRPGTYEKVFALGQSLMDGLTKLMSDAGVPGQIVGEAPLFDIVYAEGPILNYRDTLKADARLAAHFNKHLRAAGILKGDSKYYVSTAHTPDDVARTLDGFAAGIKAL